ncbi:MAG: MBL fold metallo-hydrolase [Myxococcota bacterium]
MELGPALRDEDGRFINPGLEMSHGTWGVRLRFFLRRMARSLVGRSGAAPQIENDGAFLRQNAHHSTPTVTWVGHSTLLVQMDHVSFLTDPIWSDTAGPVPLLGPRRFVPPGLALEDLPPIDFVLVSHNHYDHLDLGTLEKLAKRDPKTRFLVPLANGDLLRRHGILRVDELDWGEVRRIAGVQVHCLPAQHWSRRGLRDARRSLWASWAVTGPRRRFYFGGDSGYFAGFAEIGRLLGPFDLAALPIGAYRPVAMMQEAHLNPEEAVQAGLDLRAHHLLGVHFGTFDLSDEPLDEPPRRFREAARERGVPSEDVWILDIGEMSTF